MKKGQKAAGFALCVLPNFLFGDQPEFPPEVSSDL